MKRYVRLYWLPVVHMLSQALCIWIFIRGLLDFYGHSMWINALNALGVPLCVYNLYKMGHLVGGVHQDVRRAEAELASWQRIREQGRHIKGPEELAAYIREIEELDPAFAADLRENLQEFLPK
jgi:hypothetical protein